MVKRTERNVGTDKGPTITLHLGDEGRTALERCRALLGQRSLGSEQPSRGETARLAIARLHLSLLGERADFSDENDPALQEYLLALDALQRSQRTGESLP